jgi:hypothetical protein
MHTPTLVEPACRPTTAALGADVSGVNLQDPSPGDLAAIRGALRERLVIRLRAKDLDDVAFTRLAERFGELEGSPDYSRSRDVYVSVSPKMTVVSNVTEDGKPVGDHGDGELNWHSDQGLRRAPVRLHVPARARGPAGRRQHELLQHVPRVRASPRRGPQCASRA